MTRCFTPTQRAVLYLRARGICRRCGCVLNPASWHADHKIPFSKGGPTELWNGQALCPTCNLSKMSDYTYQDYIPSGVELRGWQSEAIEKFLKHQNRETLKPAAEREAFLLNAFPGAGKTYMQLLSAVYLRRQGTADFVVAVVPSDKLRTDFTREAKQFGLILHGKPNLRVNLETMDGIVLTYGQLTKLNVETLKLWCQTRRVMVSADEIHHLAENNSWGDGFRDAFADSAIRLMTTGTPFRSDNTVIPWTEHRVRGDKLDLGGPGAYSYGYAMALEAGGIVREVEFHSWDGRVSWQDKDGQVFDHAIAEDLGKFYKDMATDEIRAIEGARRRHCLNPEFSYTRDQIKAAHDELMTIRQRHPWAGGLIVCEHRKHADDVAALVREITGTEPVVVHGEADDYRSKLEAFQVDKTPARAPWLISVQMVTEGVDIKHLRVCVYLTRKKAPLFWTQVLGRILRWEPGAGEDQTAAFFQYNDGYNSRVDYRDIDSGTNAIYLRKYADNILKELELAIKAKDRRVCKKCGQNPCICEKSPIDLPWPPNFSQEMGLSAEGEDNERLFNGDALATDLVMGIKPFAQAADMNPAKFLSLLKKTHGPDFWKQAYEHVTTKEETTDGN